MHEVLERLRAEKSAAMAELVEFDQALAAFLETLKDIELAAEVLHAAICSTAGSHEEEASQHSAVQELAHKLSTWITLSLAAFQQLHSGVQTWNIADARSHSDLPMSGERLRPKSE